MGIITPPAEVKEKKVKTDKGFLKDALIGSLREIVTDRDGRQMTAAQAGAERLKNIWLYAESNSDSVAAGKLIFERVYGKAAVEKVDEQKEMPKVIFALNDDGLEKLNQVSIGETEIPGSEAQILIQTDDGEEMLV